MEIDPNQTSGLCNFICPRLSTFSWVVWLLWVIKSHAVFFPHWPHRTTFVLLVQSGPRVSRQASKSHRDPDAKERPAGHKASLSVATVTQSAPNNPVISWSRQLSEKPSGCNYGVSDRWNETTGYEGSKIIPFCIAMPAL